MCPSKLQQKNEFFLLHLIQGYDAAYLCPRHPETRKGVASDKMLRGTKNRHRFEDS